jgi:hypothetical protein
MSVELKPCPCCGSTEIGVVDHLSSRVTCENCGAEAPSRRRWNHRPNERTPAQEAVLRAAECWVSALDVPTQLEAGIRLKSAVDALLAAEPGWAK